MFTIWRLEDNEGYIDKFQRYVPYESTDKSKKRWCMKSAIKEYREISMSITGEKAGIYNSDEPLYPGSKNTCGLKKGRYMIVPSCKRLGD